MARREWDTWMCGKRRCGWRRKRLALDSFGQALAQASGPHPEINLIDASLKGHLTRERRGIGF